MTDTAPIDWITRDELAARLRVPVATVARWATDGRGPRFARFGKHVRYRLDHVAAWEESQLNDSGVAS